MDLIYLRLGVVTSMISKLDPESETITLDLSSRVDQLDLIMQKGIENVSRNLEQIRIKIDTILSVLADLSHTRDKISQISITTISNTLKKQVNLIALFSVCLTIAVIASIFLYFKQARISHELDQLKNYLLNIIDALPSILVGIDKNCNVTQWNKQAEEKTGLPSNKALGLHLSQALPFLATDIKTVSSVMESGQTKIEHSRARRENIMTLFEDITICPIIADGDKAAVIRVDDVTDQVQMKEMMIQSEKMLSVGGLAAGMAHEINNPLAGMMQNANVMKSRLSNAKMPANVVVAEEIGVSMDDIMSYMEKREVFKMIDAIQESGNRAAEIVRSMLSFARKTDSETSSHRPEELMDKILDLAATDYNLKKQYDFKSIEVIKHYEKDLPLLICEGAKIQQVVLNILRNCTQAMQMAKTKQPRITIRIHCRDSSEEVCIEIEDNGPGMDEETRSKVFDPFFTTKSIGVGTGLGLSVSYFIITENHQGTMDVISAPGKGANFIIRLPIRQQ